jgi:hypothetical protein
MGGYLIAHSGGDPVDQSSSAPRVRPSPKLAHPIGECARPSAVDCKYSTGRRAGNLLHRQGTQRRSGAALAFGWPSIVSDVGRRRDLWHRRRLLGQNQRRIGAPARNLSGRAPSKPWATRPDAEALRLLSHPPMRGSGKKVVRAELLPSGAHVSAADASEGIER